MMSFRPINLLLAFIIIYLPYVQHFPIVFEVKGLNMMNMLFFAVVIYVLLRKAKTQTPAPLKGYFLFFIFALCLSFLIGQFYDDSSFGDDLTTLKTNVFYMLFYFAFYYAIRDVATIRTLFAAILVVTVFVSLQCIRQGIDYGFGDFTDTHRASGPFAVDYRGANLAAAYFIIFLPLFFSVFLVYRSKLYLRLIAIAGLLVGLTGVFVTYSRQAYLILAALLFFQAARKNVLLGIIVALAVISYEAWAPEALVDRLQNTEQVDDNSGEQRLDVSTESRFILWAGAMELIAERPWGIGLNHFRRTIGRIVPEYANYDPHNGFVRVATEAGLLGVTAFVLLLVKLFRLARRVGKLDASEDTQLFARAFSISVIGVAASNLFGSRIFDGDVMGNFWILAALVARYYTLMLEKTTSGAEIVSEDFPVNAKVKAVV